MLHEARADALQCGLQARVLRVGALQLAPVVRSVIQLRRHQHALSDALVESRAEFRLLLRSGAALARLFQIALQAAHVAAQRFGVCQPLRGSGEVRGVDGLLCLRECLIRQRAARLLRRQVGRISGKRGEDIGLGAIALRCDELVLLQAFVGLLEQIVRVRAHAPLHDLAPRLGQERGDGLLILCGAVEQALGARKIPAVGRLPRLSDQVPLTLLAELCAQKGESHVVGPDRARRLDRVRRIVDALLEHRCLGARQKLVGDAIQASLGLGVTRMCRQHLAVQIEGAVTGGRDQLTGLERSGSGCECRLGVRASDRCCRARSRGGSGSCWLPGRGRRWR